MEHQWIIRWNLQHRTRYWATHSTHSTADSGNVLQAVLHVLQAVLRVLQAVLRVLQAVMYEL